MSRLAPLFLALVLGAIAPAAAFAQQTPAPATGPAIQLENDAATDAAIATRLRGILSELDGYDDVTVTVREGIVTFRGTAVDGAAIAQLGEIANRLSEVITVRNQVAETTAVAERLDPAMERLRARWRQVVATLPLLSVAAAVFVAVAAIGWLITRWRGPWRRLAPNGFIADIYRQLVRLGFVLAGLVAGLDILGATALLGTILGAAGLIGLAVGFAVRDTVENFIASIMLSIRQPFDPDDTVEIEGDVGKVVRLTSRATILLSHDGNHVRIPNATVFKSRLVNYTRNDATRIVFDLGVAPDTDLAEAQRIAAGTLQALPFVLDRPAASVWVHEAGDSSVALRLTAWISQRESSFYPARGEAIRLVMAAFAEAGIEMPEPTYRVMRVAPPDANAAAPRGAVPAAGHSLREPQDVAAYDEQALDQIVREERSDAGAQNLLSGDAARE